MSKRMVTYDERTLTLDSFASLDHRGRSIQPNPVEILVCREVYEEMPCLRKDVLHDT